MPELRGRWWRAALGMALALAAVVEIEQVARTVRAQSRLRQHVVRALEAPLRMVLPQVGSLLAEEGMAAAPRVLGQVAAAHPGAEIEIFLHGARVAAQPRPAPVDHWMDAAQASQAAQGVLVTVGPVPGAEPRMLTYARFVAGERDVVLRVATPAHDLADGLREQRALLAGQALVVTALVLAAAVVLSPLRQSAASAPDPLALESYGQAMALLRRHDQQQSERLQKERERLEERIRDTEPMARAGELTSGIVHEVRNGLGTIVGYARLAEAAATTEQAAEAARRIRAECDTLEAVVRRFVEFVRADTLQPQAIDLRRMLARVAARESGGRAGAEVVLVPGPDVSLVGDEELLERAFENLVRNAREAAGSGGHVWVQVQRLDGAVSVGVADDGPGLPPGLDAERPFQTTKPGGLGLGLPLAAKIVALHGGMLSLTARSPRGLLVAVTLPDRPAVAAAQRADPVTDSSAPTPATPPHPGRPRTT